MGRPDEPRREVERGGGRGEMPATSPLQLLGRARFYVDPGLLIHDLVAMSAGEPGAGILLSPADLLRVLGATVCEIASGTE